MDAKLIPNLILRNAETLVRRLLRLRPRPYKVLLELTDHCNSKCQTCSVWRDNEVEPKTELSLEVATRLLESSGRDLTWIALSGGEITLYRNFPALVDLLERYCPKLKIVTFTTNGLLPQRAADCARALQKLNCKLFVTVSLDGDQETHDRVRGVAGNFNRAQSTFALLQALGVQTFWGLTISAENQNYLQSHPEIWPGIQAITTAHTGGLYRQDNSMAAATLVSILDQALAGYRRASLSEWFEWIYLRLSQAHAQNRGQQPIPCEVIGTSLHIKANGEVKPCQFVEHIGDLRQNTLTEILAHPDLPKKIDELRAGQCPGCWMNCYAPHSMMQNPVRSVFQAFFGTRKRAQRHQSVTN